jgi:hypothetical protein
MDQSKYGKYIVTKLKSGIALPVFREEEAKPGRMPRRERVLWMDSDLVPGSFYSEYVWFFPGQSPTPEQLKRMGPGPHTHPFDEVIAFVGTNQDDLFDLGGEVELWLEGECFTLTRSFLVYVPAGMRHCPLKIRRIDRPIFQYTLGSGQHYQGEPKERKSGSTRTNLAGQFVFQYKKDLVHPEYRGKSHDEPGRHMHIAYLDSEVVPDANFYVEASWFGTAERPPGEPAKEPQGPEAHAHPFPELITFFGTNPDDVHDLGGEVELWIGGEQHVMTRSFVAHIPDGVIHCPLMVKRIKRPIFHFTAGPGKMYV